MIWLVLGALVLVLLGRPMQRLPSVRRSGGRIMGHLYEIVVYRDVPRETLHCLGRLAVENLRLTRSLILPCLLFTLPCLLVIIPLHASQSVRPPAPGQPVLLSVRLHSDVSPQLHLPAGVIQDTAPVKVAERREIYWRLHAESDGRYEIGLDDLTKVLYVGDSHFHLIRAARTKTWGGSLWTPGEADLPAQSWAEEIRLDYPAQTFWLGDYQLGWVPIFLLAFVGAAVGVELVLAVIWRIKKL